jgi:endonuclease YncB( thermonuclease family)
MKTRHYIVAALIIPLLILFRFVAEIGDRRPGMYVVTAVIDGDTVELNGTEKLRLLGIDTPELNEPCFDSAKTYLSNMVLGEQVQLKFGHRKRGTHRRLLGYMFLDSLFINAEILRRGFAYIYLFPDNKLDDDILALLYASQREAMADHKGIWSIPYHEENMYIANSHRMRFHRSECPSVKKLPEKYRVDFDKREDAFYDGYSPCRNCKP